MAEFEGKYKEEVRINEMMSLEMEELREVGRRNAAEASRSSVEIQTDTDDVSFKSVVNLSSRRGDVETADSEWDYACCFNPLATYDEYLFYIYQ